MHYGKPHDTEVEAEEVVVGVGEGFAEVEAEVEAPVSPEAAEEAAFKANAFTPQEAAKELGGTAAGWTGKRLRRYIRSGDCGARKIQGRWYCTLEDLEGLLGVLEARSIAKAAKEAAEVAEAAKAEQEAAATAVATLEAEAVLEDTEGPF